jgi:hypothetical protein
VPYAVDDGNVDRYVYTDNYRNNVVNYGHRHKYDSLTHYWYRDKYVSLNNYNHVARVR